MYLFSSFNVSDASFCGVEFYSNSDDNYRSIGYVVTTDYDFYGGRDERQIDDKGENIRYVSRIPNRRGGLSLFDLMLK